METHCLIEITLGKLKDIPNFDALSKKHWDSFNNSNPSFNKEILSQMDVVIVKDKETPVGYVFFMLFPSWYYSETWCQVDMFFLLPEYRRKGLGKKMFALVEKIAKEKGATKLMSSYNMKLNLSSFYSSNGFYETHVAVSKEI